jgi:hypothetical protein
LFSPEGQRFLVLALGVACYYTSIRLQGQIGAHEPVVAKKCTSRELSVQALPAETKPGDLQPDPGQIIVRLYAHMWGLQPCRVL